MASKEQRLLVFRQRLLEAPAAHSFDEAYGQICRLINEVEDELYDRRFNLAASRSDGRLYPPLWDYIFPEPGRPRVRRLVSLGHYTLIGDNGAIGIYNKLDDQLILSKAGSDGMKVNEL